MAEIAASPTSTPSLPPGVPAGLEASARYTAEVREHLGQRHPRVHLRGRRRHRRGHAPALHRQRGLRPDDQPQRRRGPDRRRHRAGHRRRPLRAPRLRRGRQPARHDVHGLPAPDGGRGARHRVRPRRDARARARRLQGRRRGRRHRRPAGGRGVTPSTACGASAGTEAAAHDLVAVDGPTESSPRAGSVARDRTSAASYGLSDDHPGREHRGSTSASSPPCCGARTWSSRARTRRQDEHGGASGLRKPAPRPSAPATPRVRPWSRMAWEPPMSAARRWMATDGGGRGAHRSRLGGGDPPTSAPARCSSAHPGHVVDRRVDDHVRERGRRCRRLRQCCAEPGVGPR